MQRMQAEIEQMNAAERQFDQEEQGMLDSHELAENPYLQQR